GLGPGPYVELELRLDPTARPRLDVGLEGRHRQRRAERGRCHRDGDGAVEVGALAGEDGVGCHPDLDVEVARGTTARADLALGRELDAGAVVDPGRDLHRDRAAGADPPVTRALAARVGDQRAEAPAGRA